MADDGEGDGDVGNRRRDGRRWQSTSRSVGSDKTGSILAVAAAAADDDGDGGDGDEEEEDGGGGDGGGACSVARSDTSAVVDMMPLLRRGRANRLAASSSRGNSSTGGDSDGGLLHCEPQRPVCDRCDDSDSSNTDERCKSASSSNTNCYCCRNDNDDSDRDDDASDDEHDGNRQHRHSGGAAGAGAMDEQQQHQQQPQQHLPPPHPRDGPYDRYRLDRRLVRHLWRLLRIVLPRWRSASAGLYVALLLVAVAQQVVVYFVGLLPSRFFAVLGSRDRAALPSLAVAALLLVIAAAAVAALHAFIAGHLKVLWRGMLTRRLHADYFSGAAFYRLNMLDAATASALDNPYVGACIVVVCDACSCRSSLMELSLLQLRIMLLRPRRSVTWA